MSATVISKEVEAHKPYLLDILVISKVIQKEVMRDVAGAQVVKNYLAVQGMRVQLWSGN